MTGQQQRSGTVEKRVRCSVLGLAALALSLGTPAGAEGLTLSGSAKNRSALFQSQTALLDGRLATQYENSDRLQPKREIEDGASAKFSGNYKGEYLAVAKAMAARHGIPEDMFLRLVQQESGWNQGAVSPKGATGLAQLMPATAARLGVDATDPQQNLDGGARYLRMMFDRFGSWRLALAAYNAGPQAVEKYGGIPPYLETQGYVTAILG